LGGVLSSSRQEEAMPSQAVINEVSPDYDDAVFVSMLQADVNVSHVQL
jgi:hypothetical protein